LLDPSFRPASRRCRDRTRNKPITPRSGRSEPLTARRRSKGMAAEEVSRRPHQHPAKAPRASGGEDAAPSLVQHARRADLPPGAVGPDLRYLKTGDIVLIASSTKRGQPVRLYQRSWGVCDGPGGLDACGPVPGRRPCGACAARRVYRRRGG
jgi:hypothetical protein